MEDPTQDLQSADALPTEAIDKNVAAPSTPNLENTQRAPQSKLSSADLTQSAPQRRAEFKQWAASHKKALLAGGAALLGMLVVFGVWLYLRWSLPSKDQVIAAFDAVSVEEGLTSSPYASNTGYVVDGVKVLSIERNGASGATAQLEATYHNDSFEVVLRARQDFERGEGAWVPQGSEVLDVDATPAAAPEADAVLADISTVLAKVAPYEKTSIERIYDGGTFEVAKRELAADKQSATLSIVAHKRGALYEYEGTITAEFDFKEGRASDDAGAWELTGASANKEAFTSSDAPIQGGWTGTLEKTTTSSQLFSTGVCRAAQSHPLKLQVSAFDPETGQVTCDLAFIAHGHGALDADAEATPGDVLVKLVGVRVELDPKSMEGTLVSSTAQIADKSTILDVSGQAQGEGKSGAAANVDWKLSFKNDGGIWRVQVESGLANSGFWGLGRTVFTDTYTLERS